MPDLLLASNLALWLAVVLLGALACALARQVGALSQRIAPAGALMVNETLRVGDAAPEITVRDLRGGELTLGGAPESGAWPGSTLVFFLYFFYPCFIECIPMYLTLFKTQHAATICGASHTSTSSRFTSTSTFPSVYHSSVLQLLTLLNRQ